MVEKLVTQAKVRFDASHAPYVENLTKVVQ